MAIDNRLYLIYNYVEEVVEDKVYLVNNPNGKGKGKNNSFTNIPTRTVGTEYEIRVKSYGYKEEMQFLLLNSDLEIITECDGAQRRNIHNCEAAILDVNCGRKQLALKLNGDKVIPYDTKTINIAPNGLFSCRLEHHWQKNLRNLKSQYITSGYIHSDFKLYNGLSFIYTEDFNKQKFYTKEDILFYIFGQSKKVVYGYVLKPKLKGLCDYPKMLVSSSTIELGFISIKDLNSILYKIRYDNKYVVGCTDKELLNLIKDKGESEPDPTNKRTILALMGEL